MRTVIALTPGAKLSGLAVVRATLPRHLTPHEQVEMALEVRDPTTLAELLLGLRERWAADNRADAVTVVIGDEAGQQAIQRFGHDAMIDVIKAQGFCEGIARTMGWSMQRREPATPRSAPELWTSAWWLLARRASDQAQPTVPNELVIGAVALAQHFLRAG